MNKIDITSTALEKGIDLAKDFLDKLIIPSVEETGLLLRDKVTLWKFKNQVRTLNKAKEYCEKHNINPKTISLKLLCPLLDYSALEESEELQDKWAILLTNLVDSEQNIENHVFPYILSQISTNEFSIMENVFDDQVSRRNKLSKELEQFKNDLPSITQKIEDEIKDLDIEIEKEKAKEKNFLDRDYWNLHRKKDKLKNELRSLDWKENLFKIRIAESQSIPEDEIKDFELSNLIRLGLVKYVQRPYANSQTLEIPYESEPESYGTNYANVDLKIEIESEEEYVITELGELFVSACKLKE